MGKTPPDLVLLNIGLPCMDGIRALEEIQSLRQQVLQAHIPCFIAQSGCGKFIEFPQQLFIKH